MAKNTNFSIDSAFVIQKKCNSETKKFGPLEQSVVQDYFSFSSEDISHFKTDLFLSFADYSLFAKKEYKDESWVIKIKINFDFKEV